MAWLTAEQALATLGGQRQTLYANVSRGRLRAKPDPKDPRRSLYHSEDVKRLARRKAGRRTVAAVAAETIGWGDPVLASGISTVADGRLWYRGQDAVVLANSATLESTATLLWQGKDIQFVGSEEEPIGAGPAENPLAAALIVLAQRAGRDPPSPGRSQQILIAEATELLDALATAMVKPAIFRHEPVHRRMARAWHASDAEDIIRRALALLADHELNASTFATRVAASTGTPLSASLLAGLSTLAGPLHGGASAGVRQLAASARRNGAPKAVRYRLEQGHPLPAFGHPLYPDGDPRAIALLKHFEPSPIFLEIQRTVEEITGNLPNIDFALAAMADTFKLPIAAPFVTFTMARSVGWIAHILEQLATGSLIRPRACYNGPALEQPSVTTSGS